MNDYNPGDGWRVANASDDLRDVERLMLVNASNTRVAAWVREEPVPPLPTEPYTVIRVQPNGDEWWRDRRGNWRYLVDGDLVLMIDITGFEVLTEPRKELDREAEYAAVRDVVRRETAKDIASMIEHGAFWDDVRRKYKFGEFEVSS